MCRHLAYLGPSVPLAELILDQPHSLYQQSWAPADMRGGGSVNADGFGIGWYDAAGEAVRYRRDVPIWADANLPGLARSIHSGAVLAAVRNGTTGMPPGEAACAPFQDGAWFFSHNGIVRGWPDSVGKLAETLPATELMRLDAPTDSALLWALIRERLRAGATAPVAVSEVLTEVVAVDPWARLNFLLTDGQQIVATSWTHALSVKATADSVAVSSEPWALADGWEPVPDRSLLVATKTSLAVTPLVLDDSMEGRQ